MARALKEAEKKENAMEPPRNPPNLYQDTRCLHRVMVCSPANGGHEGSPTEVDSAARSSEAGRQRGEK